LDIALSGSDRACVDRHFMRPSAAQIVVAAPSAGKDGRATRIGATIVTPPDRPFVADGTRIAALKPVRERRRLALQSAFRLDRVGKRSGFVDWSHFPAPNRSC
jgi:hypothetical protein